MKDFSQTWIDLVDDVLAFGNTASPRGKKTKECTHKTIFVNMRKPVLRVASRKLSYKFMTAEALWILSGDDRVETIAPYNERIKEFSDDGEKFFGAYGPKVMAQIPYILDKLEEDIDTRQAVLTIWRENPPKTKDVPCTISLVFSVRDEKLNCHAFMRSSDVWLGVPYDVFNFSMVSHYICAKFNEKTNKPYISPGILYLTAASSHIYEENWNSSWACLLSEKQSQIDTPMILWTDSEYLLNRIKSIRDGCDHDRWWEVL